MPSRGQAINWESQSKSTPHDNQDIISPHFLHGTCRKKLARPPGNLHIQRTLPQQVTPMSAIPAGLVNALQDRYRLDRELGAGGMASELVTEVTARLMSLKRRVAPLAPAGRPRRVARFDCHLSDTSRAAALAATRAAAQRFTRV